MELKSINKILSSDIRVRILVTIYFKPRTILELKDLINKEYQENYVYNAIHRNVLILKREGYVRLEKRNKEQGRPVYVIKIESEKYETALAVMRLIIKDLVDYSSNF